MKKEIIGYVRKYNGYWFFENEEEKCYSAEVVAAIDELLGTDSRNENKFKITIEKLE